MTELGGDYFDNHDRRQRLPWSLYHAPLARRLGRAVRRHGPAPDVLIVGCGLEPTLDEAPASTRFFGCDIDARAIEACRARYPELRGRLAVCPSPNELPAFGEPPAAFDVIVAKEVIEHVDDPAGWAKTLASRLKSGGELMLTTPNYGGWSTLPLLEATVLEWFARRSGFSRRHIHPSKFDRRRLAALDVGRDMQLEEVWTAPTGWALFGRWLKLPGDRAREGGPAS